MSEPRSSDPNNELPDRIVIDPIHYFDRELKEILADETDHPIAIRQRAEAFLVLLRARGSMDKIHAE